MATQGGLAGLNVESSVATELGSSATSLLTYTLSATGTTTLTGQIVLHVTSTEGAVLDIPLTVTIVPATAHLIANTDPLRAGMVVGRQTLVSFQVTNTGGAASGPLTVQIPSSSFLSLATPATIPSLAPGASASVILSLDPLLNAPLGPYAGSLLVRYGSSNLSVPFQFQAISNSQGDVQIIVDDIYTYATRPALRSLQSEASDPPRVTGAVVTLLDPYDNTHVIATGIADASGVATFRGVHSGQYLLQVSAPDHDSYSGGFQVKPGITNSSELFLMNRLVTYSFHVTPTAIADQYNFKLKTTFATAVPAPVVTLSAPETLPTLAVGETAQINLTLTNQGLIQANNVKLGLPIDPEYQLTALSTDLGTLPAGETRVVPVTVRRVTALVLPETTLPCHMKVQVDYTARFGIERTMPSTYQLIDVPDRICTLVSIGKTIETPNSSDGAGGSGDSSGVGSDTGSDTGTDGLPTYPSTGDPGILPDPILPPVPDPVPPPIVTPLMCNEGNIPCAELQLQLDQTLKLTRTAFQGTLEISNQETSGPLTQILVDLHVTDTNGHAADGLFSVSVHPVISGDLTAADGTGQLPANSTGSVTYTFIPSEGAALTSPTQYLIGGTLSFIDPDTHLLLTTPITSLPITVNPQPKLRVNYFLQKDVAGDDPFTVEVEPSKPAVLGILVTNTGGGTANGLAITTSQPEITQNLSGLDNRFVIVSTQVGNQPQTPSLDLQFGDVLSGQTVDATIQMTSTYQGIFKDFTAGYTHSPDLGGTLTSLIDHDHVQTHELIHAGNFAAPGGNGSTDYLVNDIPDANSLPDTVYLADGTTAPVQIASNVSVSGLISNSQLSVQVTAQVSSGWNSLQLPDPGVGYVLNRVIRSDGKVIPVQDCAWTTDRTFSSSGSSLVNYQLHLLDLNNTSNTAWTYTVSYLYSSANRPVVNTQPANQSVTAGNPVTFTAAATGIPSPTIQWQISVNSGTSWTDIPEATFNTYSTSTVLSDHGKQYRAVFTNAPGITASDPAILSVTGRTFSLLTTSTTTALSGINTGSINLVKFQDLLAVTNPTTYHATIDWGDGQINTNVAVTHTITDGTTISILGAHTYATDGIYHPLITLFDAAGSTLSTISSNTATLKVSKDISSRLSITRSTAIRNRTTGLWMQTVTFINTSGIDLTGNLEFALTGLTAGVTLSGATGTSNGGAIPYIRFSSTGLKAGKSISLTLSFSLAPTVLSFNYSYKAFQDV